MLRGQFVAVFLLGASFAAIVEARDVDCTGNLGGIELTGNLNVAGRCRLAGTDVKGNVTLFAGGSLVARDARIRGNVEAKRADFVDVDKTVIEGNVRLDELVGDSSTIRRSTIGGNATLTKNRSRLEILNNDFGGGLRASRNTGGLTISGNSFDGKLECTGNDPPPAGVGNRVKRGDAKGQCRNLRPDEPDEPEMPPPSPPPTTSAPPPAAAPPPPSAPPPSTSPPSPPPPTASPPSSPPPPAEPPADPPPPTTTSPPPAPPSPSTPATPEPTEPDVVDDGGAGALGWPAVLLVPLLAWRRSARRRGAPI